MNKKIQKENIVKYIDDWKQNREWFVEDINYELNLCTIILIRNNSYYNIKNGEKRINANIVNLPINKIKFIREKI